MKKRNTLEQKHRLTRLSEFKKSLEKISVVFLVLLLLLPALSACSGNVLSQVSDNVRAELPGGKAGEMDPELLAAVHAKTSNKAPAFIRPDPDTYIRTLLRQYREEGPVIAQEIGRVEDYRPLLGGANEDFSKAPQLTYDATSLLAVQKVSEEVCTALVAPNDSHRGWKTILPESPDQVATNLRFLAQRLIGLPSERISDATIAALREILNLSAGNGPVTLASYVPVCVALSVDAEALLL